MPKANNYQSLHTTVIGPYGERVEIQIRTRAMHEWAEKGIAAHWRYKEGRAFQNNEDNQIKKLREVLEIQQEIKNPKEFMSNLKVGAVSGRSLCFHAAWRCKIVSQRSDTH